jgi:hypothetical protein
VKYEWQSVTQKLFIFFPEQAAQVNETLVVASTTCIRFDVGLQAGIFEEQIIKPAAE